MAEIAAFPNTISGVADADAVMENHYAPKAVPDTFDVVNGWLDRTNLPAVPWAVDGSHIRRGAYTRVESGGATANVDLFRDFFSGQRNSSQNAPENWFPIPGAARTIRIPWAGARVMVRWNVALAGDGVSPLGDTGFLTHRAAVCLFWDDAPQWDTYRWIAPPNTSAAPAPYTVTSRRGNLFDRVYTGHKVFAGLAPGEYTFGLRGWMHGALHPLQSPAGTDKDYYYWSGMTAMRCRVRGIRILVTRG